MTRIEQGSSRPTRLRLIRVVLALATVVSALAAGASPSHITAQSDASAAQDFTGSGADVLGAPAVNLRSCASFDCAGVGTLRVGDRVTVTGPEEKGFLPVRSSDGGKSGYAYAIYISIDGQPAPWFQQGATGCKRVALIFDIGVGDPFDYGILKTLTDWETPATFFASGWTAQRDPDTIRAIAKDHFPIGIHGNLITDLTAAGNADIITDLQQAADIIRPLAGSNWIPYATPFAAATDERVRTVTSGLGFMPVGFRLPANDYEADSDPNAIWARIVPNITDGDMIEMHIDAPNSANSTGVALPWVIQALEDRGYTFVTVPDMLLPCGVTTAGLDRHDSQPGAGTPTAGTPAADRPQPSGSPTARSMASQPPVG